MKYCMKTKHILLYFSKLLSSMGRHTSLRCDYSCLCLELCFWIRAMSPMLPKMHKSWPALAPKKDISWAAEMLYLLEQQTLSPPVHTSCSNPLIILIYSPAGDSSYPTPASSPAPKVWVFLNFKGLSLFKAIFSPTPSRLPTKTSKTVTS